MKIREFNKDTDYKDAVRWWNAWGFPPLETHVLPSTGYIVEGEYKVAAGWVYKTIDTPMGWLEWIVSNKDLSKEIRGEGLDLLLEHVTKEASEEGLILFTSINNKSLGKRLEKYGFNKTDTSMTNYIRGV